MHPQMNYTDYYATLGLDKTADESQIRKGYRNLAKQYHPDTHPGDQQAEKKFKEINEAYEVLSDKQKRSRYDQLGADWNQYGDLGDIFSGFGAQEGSSRGHRVEFGSQMFDLNFSDFFETFFGDQANEFWDERSGSSKHNQNDPTSEFEPTSEGIQYQADISLEEALEGTRRSIQIREERLKTIEIKIPAGVKEGSKVRVNNESGQFYLVISLKPHPVFQVDGNSLRCQVKLQDYDALLGTLKSVPTLKGSVQMKIPAGAQTGQVFRIRGQGLPDLKHPGVRGDILASLEVQVSKNLSESERNLIERFKSLRENA